MRKALLTVIFIVFESAFAAERGIGNPATIDPPQNTDESAGSKWAVVIGVGTYDDPLLSELPLAVNDAKAVAQTLTTVPDGFPADNVILLSTGERKERSPTRANMKRFLKSYFDLAKTDDTFLIYFAGHGITTAEDKLCLMTQDAAYADPAFTAFPFAELRSMLDACSAKRKILIMDACHAGKGRSDFAQSDAAIKQMQDAEGLVILSSCDAKERSFEMEDKGHGAFTYYLLEGLKGQADENKDGYVSASEMGEYTSYATSRWAANQGFTQRPLLTIPRMHGSILLARATPLNEQKSTPVNNNETPEPMLAKVVPVPGPSPVKPPSSQPMPNRPSPASQPMVEVSPLSTVGLEWMEFGGGTIQMGTGGKQFNLSPFSISKYEVTASQFAEFLNEVKATMSIKSLISLGADCTVTQVGSVYRPRSSPDAPANCITWGGAKAYAGWLSKKQGRDIRLPSEAQWEFAAKNGLTHLKLGDFEWCLDAYMNNPYGSLGLTDPVFKSDSILDKVVRGGNSSDATQRSGKRQAEANISFRLVAVR